MSEMLALGIIAVLLFGKDLPQVAQKAGRYLAQMRHLLKDVLPKT